MLSAEHRSAPAFGPMTLELAEDEPGGTFLKVSSINNDSPAVPQNDLASRIIELLSSAAEPLTIDALRSRLQVRNQRVVEAIRSLITQGKIQRVTKGFTVKTKGNTPV